MLLFCVNIILFFNDLTYQQFVRLFFGVKIMATDLLLSITNFDAKIMNHCSFQQLFFYG